MKNKIKVYVFIVFAAIFFLLLYLNSSDKGQLVTIKSNGEIIETINLDKVSEPYTLNAEYNGYNKIYIEKGKVSVIEADCPDKICIRQSESESFPIVCLPHKLVIEKNDEE